MSISLFQRLCHPFSHRVSFDESVRRRAIRERVLNEARRAVRVHHYQGAAALIEEWGDGAGSDPACLNVMGLIAEGTGDFSGAKQHWSMALRLDPCYTPAFKNLCRWSQTFHFGMTSLRPAYGDERVVVEKRVKAKS